MVVKVELQTSEVTHKLLNESVETPATATAAEAAILIQDAIH